MVCCSEDIRVSAGDLVNVDNDASFFFFHISYLYWAPLWNLIPGSDAPISDRVTKSSVLE